MQPLRTPFKAFIPAALYDPETLTRGWPYNRILVYSSELCAILWSLWSMSGVVASAKWCVVGVRRGAPGYVDVDRSTPSSEGSHCVRGRRRKGATPPGFIGTDTCGPFTNRRTKHPGWNLDPPLSPHLPEKVA